MSQMNGRRQTCNLKGGDSKCLMTRWLSSKLRLRGDGEATNEHGATETTKNKIFKDLGQRKKHELFRLNSQLTILTCYEISEQSYAQ
jgi:hypothetical protein